MIKVRGKVFVFMGMGDEGLGFSVKLPQSGEVALALPFASPTRYGLGRSGWVTMRFAPKAKPPLDLLRDWIDESYRAVAPKTLVASTPPAKRAATERPSGRSRAGTEPLKRLRKLCLGLPETTERLSHGEATWFVRGQKTFVMYADHHHDDRVAFWCAAPAGLPQALVASNPDRFFIPPYVGTRGWLGVWLDVPVDWDEIGGIVADAHRVVLSGLSAARRPSRLPAARPLARGGPRGAPDTGRRRRR